MTKHLQLLHLNPNLSLKSSQPKALSKSELWALNHYLSIGKYVFWCIQNQEKILLETIFDSSQKNLTYWNQ